jgi:hypothetical protein
MQRKRHTFLAPSLLERAGGEAGIIMKTYIKPETTVVKIQQQSMLCESVSQVRGCDFELGGGAAVDARTREQSIWEDEW